MINNILTRKQRMDGACSHEYYFHQFINDKIIVAVGDSIGANRIRLSTDNSFNDIPLKLWDDLYGLMMLYSHETREAAGEGNSLATGVCIAKAAARHIRETT